MVYWIILILQLKNIGLGHVFPYYRVTAHLDVCVVLAYEIIVTVVQIFLYDVSVYSSDSSYQYSIGRLVNILN